MSKKTKTKNKKAQKNIKIEEKQLKSSWSAAIISYLKEFFLNNSNGVNFYHLEYDENLSEEGKRKKDLIKGPELIIGALIIGLLPLYRIDFMLEQNIIVRIVLLIVEEAVAISIGYMGITTTIRAIKNKKK